MMGPVISAKQLDNIARLVDEAKSKGVTIVTGGERMAGTSSLDGTDFSKGYYYPPTIICSNEHGDIFNTKLWKEEAFGPAIIIVPFATEHEAILHANDSEFGLGAAVWTQDLSQAFRITDQIEAGICWGKPFFQENTYTILTIICNTVNTHHRNDPSSPWGGTGSSGVGSENGKDAYYAYTTTKSTIINYATTEAGIANDDWFRDGGEGEVRYG